MTLSSKPRIVTGILGQLDRVPAGTPYLIDMLKLAGMAHTPKRALPPAQPDQLASLFETWRREDPRPLDLILPLSPDDSDLSMMAALIASLPSHLKFHNHHHTREVITLAMLMSKDLSADARREIFIASCIHDFGHDGQGNRRGARHLQQRLERRALDLAEPFLKAAGISDAAWQRVRVMVLATDVSKDDADAVSPAEWMRRALSGGDATGCPPELLPLFSDASLAHQAAILEDADLGTSAGLPYDHASRMTALIADETGVLAPNPQTLIGFLDHICHGAFLTREALELFGDNITALRARAEDENADRIYNWS